LAAAAQKKPDKSGLVKCMLYRRWILDKEILTKKMKQSILTDPAKIIGDNETE
jgi:hypothetical protein